ncbi:hypothetical protein [Saccharothrix deserti]|uniref:hypothetical protein n=1 Tax=Saccharothrix deserti TaxID=2593674 RepID=UPI00131C51DF|nr:hypothetical protein [Saccharothrix deserti]
MARRPHPDQIDLFADSDDQPVADTGSVERGKPSGYGGTPDLLVTILDLIQDGRIGQFDPSGRVVALDGDGHCRHAADDVADVVESLISQRFAAQGEFTTQRHGAVRKNLYLVKLTNAGHRIRIRWSRLAGTR